MSKQHTTRGQPLPLTAGIILAVALFLGASPAQAQWASKPPPSLPRPVLEQAWEGSVVLGLIMENNGQVRNVRVLRSSGISALDTLAREGALKWRLRPESMVATDVTEGRVHVIRFKQNAQVSRRVEPFSAYWVERRGL